jgi:5-methylcytosine-specific restriction enzyme A
MFNLLQEYDRDELLAFVGSKQGYSGIIWGPRDTRCVIIAPGGKGGKSAGYGDSLNQDGTRYYIGQGGKGDQNPNGASNSLLANGERSVLFFSTKEPTSKEVRERGNRRKRYTYEGIFQVASWEYFVPKLGTRGGDQLLRFHLIPAGNVFSLSSDIESTKPALKITESDFLELRSKILRRDGKITKGKMAQKEYIQRSKDYDAPLKQGR